MSERNVLSCATTTSRAALCESQTDPSTSLTWMRVVPSSVWVPSSV